ncbi:MAG: 23S rRNA (pseudouridine(1915)-N(3))-methyltransferase RlmH [Desulfovibrionaceae bacterium]
MAGKVVRIVAVGRLRTPHWVEAAEYYVKRLQHWRTITIQLVKDGEASLPMIDRNTLEGQRLMAAFAPHDCVICLDERGKHMTSPEFAAFLQRLSEDANKIPCFVLGGAFGLSPAVRNTAQHLVSLGPMTLPHELARVVLLEQIYRAEAIIRRVPYHH